MYSNFCVTIKGGIACLLLFLSNAYSIPECPKSNAAGDHHFVPQGYSKTIHIHQYMNQLSWPHLLNWNDAQAFCNQTYNNNTFSGGKLWEPASDGEYNAVRAEMHATFPLTGQACKWWIGVKSPGTSVPKDAFYVSSGSLISWHNTGLMSSGGTSECVAMEAGWPFMSSDGWWSIDCNTIGGYPWICESVLKSGCGPTTKKCSNAFLGLNGFCSDKSWLGGGCTGYDVDGNLLCGKHCTCCKECIDLDCSDKGPEWECVNSKTAAEYPKGNCVYDGSCKPTDTKLVSTKNCACCKKKECEDKGCGQAHDGMGLCVEQDNEGWNVHKDIDWSAPMQLGLCNSTKECGSCGCFKQKIDKCEDKKCRSNPKKKIVKECVKEGGVAKPDMFNTGKPCANRQDCHCYQSCKPSKKCKKLKGRCLGSAPKWPYEKKLVPCDKKKKCLCYIPIDD